MALNTLFSRLGFSNVCSIKGGVEAAQSSGSNEESSEYCPIPGSSIASSSIDFVKKLVEDNHDHYFTFNQYENEDNVNAHILTTGPEPSKPDFRSGIDSLHLRNGRDRNRPRKVLQGQGVKVYATFPQKPVEGIRTLRRSGGPKVLQTRRI